VIWWTSSFDHFKKRQIVASNQEITARPGLRIRVIKAPGYRRNVSLARLRDHREVSRRFLEWASHDLERPQVIVSSLPTVGLCRASIRLGKRWNVPVLVDVRDLWPDIFTEVVPRPARSAFKLLLTPLFRECQAVCRQATAIVGTTEEFLQWGLVRAKRSRTNFDAVVPFVYPENQFTPEQVANALQFWQNLGILPNEQKLVTFVGSMGRQFRLDAMIRCAHRMTAKDPSLRFALCGQGENLESYRRQAAGNPAIVLPGWIDAAKIKVLLQRTSIGFDPMPNRYDFLANINNKAVEYLAGGVPILSTPGEGTLARLLCNTGTGESIAEQDDQLLERSLTRMLENREKLQEMKVNASRLYKDHFSPDIVLGRFIQHIESMVPQAA